MKTREEQLQDRIRELEAENSALRDKLDLIYAIVPPADEEADEEGGEDGLVQIRNVN